MLPHRTPPQAFILILFLFLYSGNSSANESNIVEYNFDHLKDGNLLNQDGWQSYTGEAGGVFLVQLSGSGNRELVHPTASRGIIYRLGDTLFSARFNGQEKEAWLQFDCQVQPVGSEFRVAVYNSSTAPNKRNIGPQLEGGSMQGVGFRPSGGGAHELFSFQEAGIEQPGRNDWLQYRLWMDLSANGGEGTGKLVVRNLTRGESGFKEIANVSLGLLQGSSPQSWDGIFLDSASATGVPTRLDNIVLGGFDPNLQEESSQAPDLSTSASNSPISVPSASAESPAKRSSPPSDWVSVLETGADPSGQRDSTLNFQRAMQLCVDRGMVTVYVPAGHYRLDSTLKMPYGVTLRGSNASPRTYDRYEGDPGNPEGAVDLSGSVLMVYAGHGEASGEPFLFMPRNSALVGLTIYYPEQTRTNPPIPYPWTIQGRGDNIALRDLLLLNPYQGIDFGTFPCGRHYIENVFGHPLKTGIFVDHSLDVSRMENVHFWRFYDLGKSKLTDFQWTDSTAFLIARTDGETMVGCFAIGYNKAFHFINGRHGQGNLGPNVLLTNCYADNSNYALHVEASMHHAGISFMNSQFYGDVVVEESNAGMVRFTGCSFFGSRDGKRDIASVKIAGSPSSGGGRVSFVNCDFYCFTKNNKAQTILQANGGRLLVMGCSFINNRLLPGLDKTTNIWLGPEQRGAIITGNEFWGAEKIRNEAKGKVIISDNISETFTNPYEE